MKPTDGQNRSLAGDHRAWCRNIFDSLNDNGVWEIPRNGLKFQRQGDRLVLINRAKGFNASYQQDEYDLIKRHFGAAGIEVNEM